MRSLSSRAKTKIFLGLILAAMALRFIVPVLNYDKMLHQGPAKRFELDQKGAREDLEAFTKFPHPLGSAYQKALANYIRQWAEMVKLQTATQDFVASVPAEQTNPMSPLTKDLSGQNVFAFGADIATKPCVVLLGSHYDTKIVPGTEYVGANDSGSSSVLLLQLIRHMVHHSESNVCSFAAVWFDGEEAQLFEWTDGERVHPAKIKDNTYGSRHFVKELKPCDWEGRKGHCWSIAGTEVPVAGLILFDLVGSPNIIFTRDMDSSPALGKQLEKVIRELDLESHLSLQYTVVEDDHTPFRQAGIAAINLIDFEHLDHWHKPTDRLENVSLESINITGVIGSYIAHALAARPQDFQ